MIHRDLKPANVMVGAFGEVQVMHWGLAKDLSSEEPPTEPHVPSTRNSDDASSSGETFDLKVAGESTDEQTRAGQVLGTPAYMAPEQARGQPVDARADVFALGGILCTLLTGSPPFVGANLPEVLARAASASLADALTRLDRCDADAEITALCRRCLSPDPADRPADGQAVADELTTYFHGVQERLRAAEIAGAQAN